MAIAKIASRFAVVGPFSLFDWTVGLLIASPRKGREP